MSSVVVATECSECFVPVKVNTADGTFTVRIPSSGARGGAKRGAGFEPARTVTEQGVFNSEESLVLWECPVCGYADSTYADEATREALS